jgi:hypothetical protein
MHTKNWEASGRNKNEENVRAQKPRQVMPFFTLREMRKPIGRQLFVLFLIWSQRRLVKFWPTRSQQIIRS